MVATIPYNPFGQIAGNAGLFNTTSNGVRQGTAYADPSTRYRLRKGILAQTETIPMWGGVGIYANVPGVSGGPNAAFGNVVGRAGALTGSTKLVGFSVFDEAYAMVTTPQSPVPLSASGMEVAWYPIGSLARIAVACDPSLTTLRGATVLPQVSWDFTNQLLTPFLGSQTVSSGTYNSTTGVVSLTMTTAQTFSAGDSITPVLTGTGTVANLNVPQTATVVNGTNVQFVAAASQTLTIGGGTLTVGGAASQALPVEVLEIIPSNCETVSYNAAANTATWNYNGSCAIIALNPNG